MALDLNALSAMANQAICPIKMINPEHEAKRRIADDLQRKISGNRKAFAGVNTDGTVLIKGKVSSKIKKAAKWTDTIAVSMGDEHIVGLKKDGTVVAEGKNKKLSRPCNTEHYKNIDAICAGYSTTMVLQKGIAYKTNREELFDSSHNTIEGIVQISTDGFDTVFLLNTGKVTVDAFSSLREKEKFADIGKWEDIVQISHSSEHIMGLRTDGTVAICGSKDKIFKNLFEVLEWRNIVSIASNSFDAIGLHADGTVVSTFYPQIFDEWKDIIAIGSCSLGFYGIRKDGAILSYNIAPLNKEDHSLKLF